MNPHFIFNVLTGIQNLLQEGKSEKAGTVFSRFRRLLILGFMSQDRVLGPLAHEMDHVEQYLELERTRLSESINFRWEIVPDVLPAVIPCPLFIHQPLVENAIWHGLSGTGVDQPTSTIQIHWQEQDLVIAVCDRHRNPTQIRSKSSHKSRGTAIVKERLALLRHRGQLEILDCPVGHPFAYGVTAWMTLPLWSLEPTWHANEKRIAS
jgi:sensor histidine kinase YesM